MKLQHREREFRKWGLLFITRHPTPYICRSGELPTDSFFHSSPIWRVVQRGLEVYVPSGPLHALSSRVSLEMPPDVGGGHNRSITISILLTVTAGYCEEQNWFRWWELVRKGLGFCLICANTTSCLRNTFFFSFLIYSHYHFPSSWTTEICQIFPCRPPFFSYLAMCSYPMCVYSRRNNPFVHFSPSQGSLNI